MSLSLQEVTAIATALGAAITAALKGHDAYERFKRDKAPKKKPPRRAGVASVPRQMDLFQ